MEFLDFKEKLTRIKFFIFSIRYYRKKHLYISMFLVVVMVVISITILFLKQKNEIKQKENILKSYYDRVDDNFKNSSDIEILSVPENENILNEDCDETENMKVSEEIKVYICGFVKNPGVYELESDSRIIDLLLLCGGETQEACLEVVNLAQKISDGDMVYIPSEEEIKESGIANFAGGFITNSIVNISADNDTSILNVININTATQEELIMLPGIGEKTAKNIIDYRNKYGFFKTKEEIKNVKGIGEKKYEKIKDLIMV